MIRLVNILTLRMLRVTSLDATHLVNEGLYPSAHRLLSIISSNIIWIYNHINIRGLVKNTLLLTPAVLIIKCKSGNTWYLVERGLVNCDHQGMSGPPPGFVSGLLLKCSCAPSVTFRLWLCLYFSDKSGSFARVTIWPTKPTIFATLPYSEKSLLTFDLECKLYKIKESILSAWLWL